MTIQVGMFVMSLTSESADGEALEKLTFRHACSYVHKVHLMGMQPVQLHKTMQLSHT